jgi:hypothetical protein
MGSVYWSLETVKFYPPAALPQEDRVIKLKSHISNIESIRKFAFTMTAHSTAFNPNYLTTRTVQPDCVTLLSCGNNALNTQSTWNTYGRLGDGLWTLQDRVLNIVPLWRYIVLTLVYGSDHWNNLLEAAPDTCLYVMELLCCLIEASSPKICESSVKSFPHDTWHRLLYRTGCLKRLFEHVETTKWYREASQETKNKLNNIWFRMFAAYGPAYRKYVDQLPFVEACKLPGIQVSTVFIEITTASFVNHNSN